MGGAHHINLTPADRAVTFINQLTHTKDQWAGKPFSLRPWQEHQIIRPLFGTLLPDKRRQYRTCYVEIPRKNGKALWIDTPLPTPSGWTTMRDVKEGDWLLNHAGQPTRVIGTSAVMWGHDCYRAHFSDGTSIVADAEHEWTVRSRLTGNPRGRPMSDEYRGPLNVRTTEQIRDSLYVPGKILAHNHSISVAGPLQLPAVALPFPPYTLGAWLGDGRSAGASITVNDPEILEHIREEGMEVHAESSPNRTPSYRLGSGSRAQADRDISPQARLREIGVLGNKHIPAPYLRASQEQRMALLQGLMDTDGYCSAVGQCEYTTTVPALRDGVMELLRSLGFKPVCHEGRAVLRGQDHGAKYRIVFAAWADRPVFALKRKRDRMKAVPGRRATRAMTRQIVAIEPIPSVPVKCVAVDAISRLYLAGESMIPTHNTELAAAIALYMLLGDDTVGARVYSAAGDLEQASLAFDVAAQMVRNDRDLSSELEIVPSRKRIVHHKTGSYYRAIPADAGGAHGFDASAVIVDELHVWAGKNGRDLWTALRTSTGARSQPLTFIITTAGWDRTSLCWEMHEYAERVKATPDLDPTFLPVLYGAPIDAPWDDEKVWHAANPALGDYRSLEEMRIAARQAREIPSQQNEFRQLYLCQWTEQRERWLDMAAWRRCRTDVSDAALVGLPCYAGLDLGQTDDFSAFVRMWCLPDGKRAIRANFWLPQATLKKYRHRPYGVWQDGGWLTVTEGQTVDYDQVETEVAQLCRESNVRALAYDPRFADQMRVHLEQQGVNCIKTPQGFALNEALTNLQTLIVEQKLSHDGNPIMDWHASNAVVRRGKLKGDIWLDKEQAGDKIDGIAALAMVNNLAMLHIETPCEAVII